MKWVFCNCQSLTMIAILELVTQIDVRAFQGCWQLKDMHVPSNVTDIAKAVLIGILQVFGLG